MSDETDLRIEVYRPSSVGAIIPRSMNPVVHITHIPSGLTAHCGVYKSLADNKAQALEDLVMKVEALERALY